MIGAHYADPAPGSSADTGASQFRPTFTRPIYPYSLSARYKGAGDPNSAESFKSVTYAN